MDSRALNSKKRRGPVPTGQGLPVIVRLHAPLLDPLDSWIAAQPDPKLSRPEAIRRLLNAALESTTPDCLGPTSFHDFLLAFFEEDPARLQEWGCEAETSAAEAVQIFLSNANDNPGPAAHAMLQALEGYDGKAAKRLRAVLAPVAYEIILGPRAKKNRPRNVS